MYTKHNLINVKTVGDILFRPRADRYGHLEVVDSEIGTV